MVEAVIAIVGRPNVGKSTLFNQITKTRQALVADFPGMTRDRQFGEGEFDGQPFIVIDTPGLLENPEDTIESGIIKQTQHAIEEADILLWICDVRSGLLPQDLAFAKILRKIDKPVLVLVNKSEGMVPEVALSEFYRLGFERYYAIAATHNSGVQAVLADAMALYDTLPKREQAILPDALSGPKVAIIGKPNAGKSTLLNRMLGEERTIASDIPGTTRDSIYVSLERMGKPYVLIDTAGIRRKKNVFEAIEKFSIIKTLQAIKDAQIVMMVFDAKEGLSDQDLNLIAFVMEAGRGLIICANKWDGMSAYDREQVKEQLGYRLRFAQFGLVKTISALHGSGVGDLFSDIDAIYQSISQRPSTSRLSDMLKEATTKHMPPLVHGRRIKLRYAHLGGHYPLTVVVHGNQTANVPDSYTRYLSKYFTKNLNVIGSLVKIVYRTSENPYKDRKNPLTERQVKKRRRLMKHVKKQK